MPPGTRLADYPEVRGLLTGVAVFFLLCALVGWVAAFLKSLRFASAFFLFCLIDTVSCFGMITVRERSSCWCSTLQRLTLPSHRIARYSRSLPRTCDMVRKRLHAAWLSTEEISSPHLAVALQRLDTCRCWSCLVTSPCAPITSGCKSKALCLQQAARQQERREGAAECGSVTPLQQVHPSPRRLTAPGVGSLLQELQQWPTTSTSRQTTWSWR